MELLQDERAFEVLFVVVMIVFLLWLLPQAVDCKPFFTDLEPVSKPSNNLEIDPNLGIKNN